MQFVLLLYCKSIIAKELFEALSLNQDELVGVHNLPVCDNFFASRDGFISDLETKLSERIKPVIFLSGEPGSGKTNTISRMENKRDSVISLRFHAFKPLQVGDMSITADEGVYKRRDFWSDLLILLRDNVCKGHIAEYNIPVCNALIKEIDGLRKEVLRIAKEYVAKHKKTFIIAVDGIDHTARAGKSDTFLETLPCPDEVPDGVCFLIAGQPLKDYEKYPRWLSGDDVLKL